jgi:hypothetical protein
MHMKLKTGLFSLVAVLGLISLAVAGPIPPGPLVSGSMGESDLATNGAAIPDTPDTRVNVDWIVGFTGDPAFASWVGMADESITIPGAPLVPLGAWIYLYQGENTNVVTGFAVVGPPPGMVTTGINMTGLTIGVPVGSVIAAGDLQLGGVNADLDVAAAGLYPAHLIGTPADSDTQVEPELTDEEEGDCPAGDVFGPSEEFCFNPDPPSGGATTLGGGPTSGSVTWSFFKPPKHENNVLWFASLLPPVYGPASALDSGFSWSTGNTDDGGVPPGAPAFTGEPVPVPGQIPEPTILVLFGIGLAALGLRRQMKR